MRLYRIHRGGVNDGHAGFEFHASEAAANRAANGWKRTMSKSESDIWVKVEPIDVMPTRAGLLAALNRYASHPDNG